jgi:hypothetical protein
MEREDRERTVGFLEEHFAVKGLPTLNNLS